MKRLIYILIVLTLVVSCNSSTTDKKKDDVDGLRIISLAPSVTKEIIDLGLRDNLVGVTSYCKISSENKELIIGTAVDVNIEKVLLLKPDIVFATGLTTQNNIETLRNNGIKVYEVPKLKSFNDICTHFIELGQLVGKEDVAELIVKESKETIDSLKMLITTKDQRETMFFQIGAKPLFAVIPNTFMDDYITFSNCDNVVSDLTKGTVTRESILKRNPDIIFIATMGILGDQEKQEWKKYEELSAAKNNKVFIIDSNLACTPTVLSFIESLEIIVDKIYQ